MTIATFTRWLCALCSTVNECSEPQNTDELGNFRDSYQTCSHCGTRSEIRASGARRDPAIPHPLSDGIGETTLVEEHGVTLTVFVEE